MRISDWSSDVCSSDLATQVDLDHRRTVRAIPFREGRAAAGLAELMADIVLVERVDRDVVARALEREFLRRREVMQIALSPADRAIRSDEHTSELQSLMRLSSAVVCLKTKKNSTPST